MSLGLHGSLVQRRHDRPGWWLLLVLFLVTGLGLGVYLNFKPGFSVGYDRYPEPGDHEVRERDYFFVVSFIVWGLWAGIGAAAMAADLARREWGGRVAPALLLLALVPLFLNWNRASRRHGPDEPTASANARIVCIAPLKLNRRGSVSWPSAALSISERTRL